MREGLLILCGFVLITTLGIWRGMFWFFLAVFAGDLWTAVWRRARD